MSFREICRIPGRTGLFDVRVENDQLKELTPVGETNRSSCLWLSPGLFDIQVNGMLGHSLSGEALTSDHVLEINAELEKHGITRWCPTVTTQDSRIVERNLAIINQVIASKKAPGIHCIHLEGHYISSEEGYRGVHQEEYIRDPEPRQFDRWQKAAGGHVGLFSLAPERKGALEFIQKLRREGIRAGLVHHHADHDTVLKAVAAGADLSSHLVNGCATMIHRQHNVIWSQLSIDELWASFIADGFHIPDYTLRAIIKSKGLSRSILVSDLSNLSGLPDGEYERKGRTVILRDGGCWVKGQGTNLLSGAAKTLERDCEYLAVHSGFSIEEAMIMASLNPARYFGIDQQIHLFPDRKGVLVAFSWQDAKLKVERILK
jgi:N-acetylglucosamine-6-phosphate deacetylase